MFVEFRQRQLVDCSNPTYTSYFENTRQPVHWDRGRPARTERSENKVTSPYNSKCTSQLIHWDRGRPARTERSEKTVTTPIT